MKLHIFYIITIFLLHIDSQIPKGIKKLEDQYNNKNQNQKSNKFGFQENEKRILVNPWKNKENNKKIGVGAKPIKNSSKKINTMNENISEQLHNSGSKENYEDFEKNNIDLENLGDLSEEDINRILEEIFNNE